MEIRAEVVGLAHYRQVKIQFHFFVSLIKITKKTSLELVVAVVLSVPHNVRSGAQCLAISDQKRVPPLPNRV